MKPLVLLNFKTYPEATGKKAVALARKLANVKSTKFAIAFAPPLLELEHVCKVANNVFAQHVDPDGYGAHTGQITAKDVKNLGARGTLLNHSEHKLSFPVLKKTLEECRRDHLTTVVCAGSLAEVRNVARLKPDYIAYEPPELIGGDRSVTSAEPDVIQKAVQAVRTISSKTKVLVGAGVQSREDVRMALKLGAKGVLIGHAVPKAKEPKKFLERLLG